MITTTEVLHHANKIREFCLGMTCSNCPFYGVADDCMFNYFAPISWTNRTFKDNSEVLKNEI